MADLNDILRDGENVSMPALRAYFGQLESSIAEAGSEASEAAANAAAAAEAFMDGALFTSTAAGIAGVADGKPFLVQGTSGGTVYATLYRKVGGVAVSQGLSIPSSAALGSLTMEGVIGRPSDEPFVDGNGLSQGTYVYADPMPYGGRVIALEWRGSTSGAVSVRRYDRVGDVFTQSGASVSTFAGVANQSNTDDFSSEFLFEAGQHLGFWAATSVIDIVSNEPGYSGGYFATGGASSVTSFTDTQLNPTNQFQIRILVEFHVVSAEAIDAIRTKVSANDDPTLGALTALVVEEDTGKIIWAKGSPDDTSTPPYSLTKLVTALVARDWLSNNAELVTVVTSDMTTGSASGIAVGDILTLEDYYYGLILPSGNDDALLIARWAGRAKLIEEGTPSPTESASRTRFYQGMNAKVAALGCTNSSFVEPTGLSTSNTSSPRDMARIMHAVHQDSFLDEVSGSATYSMSIVGGPRTGQSLAIEHSSALPVDGDVGVVGCKTGSNGVDEYNIVVLWENEFGTRAIFQTWNSFTQYIRDADMRELIATIGPRIGYGSITFVP